ncbi:acetyl-CoA acetyltransferase [Anthonomus grandis grandis]|uniref:acetyl-CoA acetyltransferase n=1 Tax=Anthonomus grandis grandis TaxID=2921223 RepID=UPI0021660844|nr:acetyl-CoA acetyltransferase [Anthonomus grandis grandis]
MSKVFIISACRTPIGSFQGQFEKHSASELGAIVINEAVLRAKLIPEDIDQCIMGQVLTAGQGQNPARQASVQARIPQNTTAFTVNMLCGSGLKAVALGFQAIKNDDCAVVVVGGQENMTRAQHSAYMRGAKLGSLNLCDTILNDGLTDAFHKVHMGNTAEHLAKTYNIPKQEQDKFALLSQTKALAAQKSGYFDAEIVGVQHKKTKSLILRDEYPKADCTLEKLAKLPLVFDQNGTVTAGNASGINDGAAALVLSSGYQVMQKGMTPLAEILAYAEVGIEPMCMGLGPIEAVRKVLSKCGWSKDDVDLFELNEAFAVQSLICMSELELDVSKVNVTGGAIALGHPIGASGARCLVTLIHNLMRLKKKKGVVALCIGGGMGIAMAVELC